MAAKKTGGRAGAKAKRTADDRVSRSDVIRVEPRTIPVILASDPPILPPYADFVEVHAYVPGLSIVFGRIPFQAELAPLKKGAKAVVAPVASVTVTSASARMLIALLEDALKIVEEAEAG